MGFNSKRRATNIKTAQKRKAANAVKNALKPSTNQHLLHPKLNQEPLRYDPDFFSSTNPDESLLTVMAIQAEPPLDDINEKPLIETQEPKLETFKPTDDPIPEVALFCSLCLRQSAADQVVEFSSELNWNCLDVASGQGKLGLILGLELELERCAICRPCWTMVETLADFRECCLKAALWRKRFSFELDGDRDDDWLSNENLKALERTRKVVQEHVERMEMAEVNARNKVELSVNKLQDEDEQVAWHADAYCSNSPDLPEEPPSIIEKSVEKVEKLDMTAHTCSKCERKFETKNGLLVHFKTCRKSVKNKCARLHTCSVCSVNFRTLYHLEAHLNKHKGSKPYECRRANCNKRFFGVFQQRKHEKRCKANVTLNSRPEFPASSTFDLDETKIHSCDKCPRKFQSKQGLTKHRPKCKGAVEIQRLFTCSICSIDFVLQSALQVHMNKHNGIKPYKCRKSNCNQHFYGNIEQYRHEKTCGIDKPVCPLCGFQPASTKGLKNHMIVHQEPMEECETCGKKFKSKAHLKKHQSVHSGERNWSCAICGKGFKSANAARVHKRIHTQEKPFSCHICGQGFAYKCLVQPHVQKCHADEA